MSNRYAVHPLVRGYPIEHFLKHLIDSPESSSHTKALATDVLANGNVNSFYPLQDSLLDDGHPLAHHYNLPAAAYKIPLDHAMRPYVDSLADRYSTGTANAARFARFAATGHLDSYLETPERHRHSHWLEPLGVEAVNSVRRQFPDADDATLREALERLGTHAWREYDAAGEQPVDMSKEHAEEALAPASDYEGHRLHKTVSASRYRRGHDDSLGDAFNAEFRKLADRLNPPDREHFVAQNHFGYLVRVAKGNKDLAHDLATHLLYGDNGTSPLARNYDAARPLWTRFRGQATILPKSNTFVKRRLGSTAKQFAGTFSDVLRRRDDRRPPDLIDRRAGDPADIAAANEELRLPTAGRTLVQDEWRKRQAELPDAHHVARIGKYLAKYPQGVPLTKLTEHLRVGDRVRDLLAQSGAVVAPRKTRGKPASVVYPAGTVPPESAAKGPARPLALSPARREFLSRVVAMREANLSLRQIAGRVNRNKQTVWSALRTAARHGVAPAAKYARVEPHHVLGPGVDPLLLGGRLAYHLQQLKRGGDETLANLAARALSGRNWHSGGTDVFKELGLALKHRGHELGSAYNWHRAADSLYTDGLVKEFVDSVASPALGNSRYRTAAKRFGLGTGTGGDAKTSAFWDALRKHVRGRNANLGIRGERLSDAMLDRSLRRLGYREEDAEEVERSKSSRVRTDKPGPNGTTEHPWRTYLGFLPGVGSAERYSRLDRLKQFVGRMVRNRTALPHSEYDGVIYRGRNAAGGLDADGYPKVLAERAAVTHALNRLGYVTSDPGENRRLVDKYTRLASRLSALRPDHPVVAHYRAAASRLNSPSVVADPENPSAYLTVGATGPAGRELGHAAVPLVRFVTHLFPEPKRGLHHWALRGPADRDPVVDLADSQPAESTEPHEYVPAVKPAPDEKPIPVARVRGEKGPGGLRHAFVAEMEARGYAKPAVVAALKHEFLISHREAAATYTGYTRAKRKPAVTAPPPRAVDEPLQLSRQPEHESTFDEALRRMRSGQQTHLRQIAETVHKALGLVPVKAMDIVHSSPSRSVNSVLHSVSHPSDPATVEYGAAVFGNLTQSPGQMVFHVGGGPDSVYKVKTTGTGNQVRDALAEHGIPQFSLATTPTGWDVYIPDPGRRLSERVQAFATGQRSPVYESKGNAVILGDGKGSKADAATRHDFRSVIERYETGGK